MAKITLTPQELIAQSAELASLQKEYEALLKKTNATLADVNGNWSAALARNFTGKISSTKQAAEKLVDCLEAGVKVATASAESLESVDSQLAKLFGGDLAGAVGAVSSSVAATVGATAEVRENKPKKKKNSTAKKKKKKKSAWDKFCDKVGEAKDAVCTGVAKAVDVVEDGVESAIDFAGDVWDKGVDLAQDVGEAAADLVDKGLDLAEDAVVAAGEWVSDTWDAAVDSYQNKGTIYKVIKTGAAVASTIGAVTSIVGSWGAAAGSGGLATGLAVVSTTYGVNTIANSFADIYNCWAGDVDQVGNVDLLKTGTKIVTGAAGEAVGDLLGDEELGREIGERVGGVLYTGGKIVSVVNNISVLSDKVTQLDDYGMTLKEGLSQLKEGADGAIDIALNSELGNVALDLKLLSHQVPELVEAWGVVKTGGEIISTGWDLGGKITAVVNEATGNTGGGPSLWKVLGWDEVDTVMNVVKDVKGITDKLDPEKLETIKDGFEAGQIIMENNEETLEAAAEFGWSMLDSVQGSF